MARRSDPHVPIRTCVGCRRRRPQAELLRCVLGSDGVVRVDRRAPGRGAWLCGPDCLAAARRRRGFERAWRTAVPAVAIERFAIALTDGTTGGDRPHRCETETTTKG